MRFWAKHLLSALPVVMLSAQVADVAALVREQFPNDERLQELQIPELFQTLGVKEGSRVADIGAGPGDFTVLLAQVSGPGGRIFAVDVNENNVGQLRERVRKMGLRNVEVILGAEDDPKLPADSLDGILIVESYHHFAKYESMLEHMLTALKPGGRLMILDGMPMRTRSRPRAVQVKNHRIAPELVESELQRAGFEITDRRDGYVDNPDEEGRQWLTVARRPRRTTQ
jgi:ubiquinone/menaquinone biosynthesis C-methylase UbiE